MNRHERYARCETCTRQYPIVNGVVVFGEEEQGNEHAWSRFYDQWHVQTARPQASGTDGSAATARNALSWVKGRLRKSSLLRSVHDRIYFHECRKSWFLRKCFRGMQSSSAILDLGCGKGNPLLTEFGSVAGVDLSHEALAYNALHHRYDLLVRSDVTELPFDDSHFDAVVSVSVYGHIENDKKDRVLQEVRRVLRPNGRLFWVIETDCDNLCLSFAKKYPQLYWDKVIMQYGHVGLEYPNQAISRFQKNGFAVRSVKKTWGPIWSASEYLEVFDNEYVTKSPVLKGWVQVMRYVAARRGLEVAANALLGIASQVYDRVSGIDRTMGLLVFAEKQPSP